MSVYLWRWSPSDEDFVPEARFLTQADGEAYIAELKKKYPADDSTLKHGLIVDERPGDRELFETYQKARRQLREYWRALRASWRQTA